MCGCWRCGEPTYGLIPHTEENCINALKGARDSAREGREMVREALTGERDRYREALVAILDAGDQTDQWEAIDRAREALDA